MTNGSPSTIGVVVIGRDEGERFKKCLRSLAHVSPIIYVDSGSVDGSVEVAEQFGAIVVRLTVPPMFTAARARNAGFEELLRVHPDIKLVQMVDGDCAVMPDWLNAGRAALESDPSVAAVFGRCREIDPGASIYNFMCDIEWDGPAGFVNSCGGNALFRADALAHACGYDPTLIAGEEPDLCLRLRMSGWKIMRLADEMTAHDAAIYRLGQWWRRVTRSGHAYAELAYRHGRNGDPLWLKQAFSIILWGLIIPTAVISGLFAYLLTQGLFFVLAALGGLLLFVFKVVQVASRTGSLSGQGRERLLVGFLTMFGKIPEFLGVARFWFGRILSKPSSLIEYKDGSAR